jgi:hypothetical protein
MRERKRKQDAGNVRVTGLTVNAKTGRAYAERDEASAGRRGRIGSERMRGTSFLTPIVVLPRLR